MAAAGLISVGKKAYIQYDGFDEWHGRLFLAEVDENEWVICTGDFDMYAERFNNERGHLRHPVSDPGWSASYWSARGSGRSSTSHCR